MKDVTMKKDIKDYLHLYPGCEVLHNNGDSKYNGLFHITSIQEDGTVVMRSNKYPGVKFSFNPAHDKPLFRKLSSITEEEASECYHHQMGGSYAVTNPKHALQGHFFPDTSVQQMALGVGYLLSKGFWLFGEDWFDEGLILDKDTVK